MDKWSTSEILVLGSTYPAYSSKYTEIACTGGILTESLEMVRLHPVPLRYLESNKRFKTFQLISAELTKNTSDPRPESMRMKKDSIRLGDIIPAAQPERRIHYLENSPHLVASVEELQMRQESDGTSLGIVKPKEILLCKLEKRSAQAKKEWAEKEKQILDQGRLFDEIKPIDFPETRFKVIWRCDDPKCTNPHEMSLLQWGLHELNRKYRDDPERKEKILAAMRKRLDQDQKDIYFFLGSYRGRQYHFGLMDSYSAPKVRQTGLFN